MRTKWTWHLPTPIWGLAVHGELGLIEVRSGSTLAFVDIADGSVRGVRQAADDGMRPGERDGLRVYSCTEPVVVAESRETRVRILRGGIMLADAELDAPTTSLAMTADGSVLVIGTIAGTVRALHLSSDVAHAAAGLGGERDRVREPAPVTESAAAFESAQELMRTGRYREAVPLFQTAALTPHQATRALHAAGHCLRQLGADAAAHLLYQRAAFAAPGPGEQRELYDTACALQDAGWVAEAAERFEILLAWDAAYADAWQRRQACRDARSPSARPAPASGLLRIVDELDERGLIPADGHDSDTFDEAFYRHFEHPTVHDSAKKRLEMVGLLALCCPGNVTSSLDVGSGTLRYPQVLDGYGIQSCGIDLNDSGVRSCVDAWWVPRFAVADGTLLPFRDSAFDLVTCMMGTINHFSQKQRAMFFAESYRVLRPGGRLVVSAWDPACTFQGFLSFYSPTRIQELRSRLKTRADLAIEAQSAGYETAKATPVCIFPDWLVTNRGIYECGARLLASLVEWDQRQIERNPDCNGQMFLLTCWRAA